eukprot:TRINITY_DN3366_c0_g1_i2.p1 TRINITY_DN3366_c0_g1~~TRINITY_DN3366_c0_g1_i2.p1  ORF type:complete len:142 (+),score=36.57 TRINITY_DN3366_c0_g1_i2:376-801(+)
MICHCPSFENMTSMFTQFNKLLKPGGKLLVLTMNDEDSLEDYLRYKKYSWTLYPKNPTNTKLESGYELIYTTFNDKDEVVIQAPSFYWAYKDLEVILKKTGFDHVQFHKEKMIFKNDGRDEYYEDMLGCSIVFQATKVRSS